MNKYDSIGEFLKDNTYNKKIKEIYIAIICLSISIILLGISQVAHTASHLTPSQEPEIALSEPLIDLCEHNDISCD